MATIEVQKVEISTDDKFENTHCVPLDAPLTLLNQFNSHYVCFHLLTAVVIPAVNSTARNVCEVLMQQSKEQHLPPTLTGTHIRADQQVYNKLLEVLGTLKVGWSPSIVNSTGKKFVHLLAACLWYLDCHHDNFLGQGIHIPQLFATFQGIMIINPRKSRSLE